MVEVECSICWDTIQPDQEEAGLKCCSTKDDEDTVLLSVFSWLWEEESCPKLHRTCLSKYLIMQAESGRFPPKCPFCLRKLSLAEVYKNLTAAEKSTWLRYHDRWRELREFGRADADLEEIVALQELGCRRCPSCGTWIQKQSAGWVTGCDKMTCRCGGRFCFQCGSVDATCSCNLGHDFLEKELVLANYSLLDLPWPLSLLLEDVPDIDSSISSVSVSRDLVQGFQGPQVQDEDEEDEEQDEDEDIYWATARQEAHKEEDQGPSPSGTAAQGLIEPMQSTVMADLSQREECKKHDCAKDPEQCSESVMLGAFFL